MKPSFTKWFFGSVVCSWRVSTGVLVQFLNQTIMILPRPCWDSGAILITTMLYPKHIPYRTRGKTFCCFEDRVLEPKIIGHRGIFLCSCSYATFVTCVTSLKRSLTWLNHMFKPAKLLLILNGTLLAFIKVLISPFVQCWNSSLQTKNSKLALLLCLCSHCQYFLASF